VFFLNIFFFLLILRDFYLSCVCHLSIFEFINLNINFILTFYNWFLLFWLNEWINKEVFSNWKHFLGLRYIMNAFKDWIFYFLLIVSTSFLLSMTKYFLEFLFFIHLTFLFPIRWCLLLLLRYDIWLTFDLYLFHLYY
jgi:hypothetical protein